MRIKGELLLFPQTFVLNRTKKSENFKWIKTTSFENYKGAHKTFLCQLILNRVCSWQNKKGTLFPQLVGLPSESRFFRKPLWSLFPGIQQTEIEERKSASVVIQVSLFFHIHLSLLEPLNWWMRTLSSLAGVIMSLIFLEMYLSCSSKLNSQFGA